LATYCKRLTDPASSIRVESVSLDSCSAAASNGEDSDGPMCG
jgi:hypothetical protein